MDKNILFALVAVLVLVVVIVLISPDETELPAEPVGTATESKDESSAEDAVLDLGELKVDGYVVVKGDSLEGVEVCLLEWHSNEQDTCVRTDEAGRFVLYFPFDGEYKLLVSHQHHYPKFLYIDTRNVPGDALEFDFEFGGFTLHLLPKKSAKQQPAWLDKPVAKIRYDTAFMSFDYDRAWDEQLKQEQEQ